MTETATKTYKVYELTRTDASGKEYRAAERSMEKPHPHQVVIKMKAASLNFRDLLVCRGLYGNVPLPLVPLSDGAGEVIEIGERVKKFKVGDRVSPAFMPDWISGAPNAEVGRTALGGFVDGCLREYATFSESALVKIPDYLSYEEAACLPCAAVTVWNAIFEGYNLKPGQTVLTLGTGGVSIFALQLARAAGAKVIATSSSDEKIARLKEMGAHHTINYKTTPKWDKEVLDLTDGNGVDLVVEVGGAGTLERSIKSARVGGHIALIGVLAQPESPFNPVSILMKSIDVQGVFVGSRAMYEELNRSLALHKIKPVIDKVFPAEQIVEAINHLESGKHFGKVVLKF
ncbi:MAG: NAD(P)-dependent alcohol dehydrogenase [Cyanobacteria bacterium REEB67]|nr:NAD(P)-dependent alcohol dehydrogenase [Cyanobacteria bacterium REEB67]